MKVFLISPQMSGEATGEAFVAFKFAQAIQNKVDLTVACFHSSKHTPLSEQLPQAEVITFPQPQMFRNAPRFRAMFKPEWFLFSRKIKAILAQRAGDFDIAHQIMPLALRYTTPLRGFGIPYVMGPLGGTLRTPPAFVNDGAKGRWFTRFRAIDSLRIANDPFLRATYRDASLILGVAPYTKDILSSIPLQDYKNMLELGIDGPAEEVDRSRFARPEKGSGLRLLHVGRGVRTKGLREVIRALAQVDDQTITLTSAGDGEDIAACQAEAKALGVAARVTFLGAVPRARVEELYQQSDVFAFPSFREPTGGVLYEAMRWGLPVIGAATGGPDFIVDENTGIKVRIETPDQVARDVAAAITVLAEDPGLRRRLGDGGKAKVLREGLWPAKADALVNCYRSVLARD